MDTNKIKSALEHLRDIGIVNGWQLVADHARQALAELDKAQQPGKVLTDEELIVAYNRAWQPAFEANDHTCVVKGYRAIERLVMERSGYLAPAAGLTVEEVMENVGKWIEESEDAGTPISLPLLPEEWAPLRARLTAAIEAKRTA